MPSFMVTSPDGRKFKINAPEGATHEDAIAYAKSNLPAGESAPSAPQQPSPALAFGNRGIANALGAPVDLVQAGTNSLIGAETFSNHEKPPLPEDAGTFARVARGISDIVPEAPNPLGMIGGMLRSAGAEPIEKSFLGSSSIADIMRAAGTGVAPANEKAETLGAQVMEGVGGSVGGLLPMGMLAKGASLMPGAVASNVGKSMLEGAAARPIVSTGIDVAAGAGSGVGGAVADELDPNDPMSNVMGQIIGGFAPAGGAAGIAGATRLAARGVSAAAFPYTDTGATIRAARRVQSLVPDPAGAAAILDEPTISNLSPAQRIGDERLLALQKEVMDENVQIDSQLTQQNRGNLDTLKDEMNKIRGEGSVAETKASLSARQEKLSSLLDARLKSAMDNTDVKVSKLAPEMRGSQSSVIAREQLESALNDARVKEKEFWGQIPDNILVDKTNTTKKYEDLIKNTPRAQQDDIPRALMAKVLSQPDEAPVRVVGSDGRPLLGDKVPATERVTELQGLRSKLLEGSRKARAEGNYNSARIHDELADSVLNDIGAAPDRIQGETGQKIRDALDFSRQLNEKFTRGEVGRILGTSRTGGDKVAPEMTLGSLIGGGKVKGSVAFDNMMEAADTPELKGSVEDYLKEQLSKSALKDGSINSSAARKFLDQNVDILDKFPELKKTISDAADSGEKLLAKSMRTQQAKKTLITDSKNHISKFINAPIDKEFDVILGSRDPAGFTKDLVNRAAKDSTGAAAKGLKASAVDYLMEKSTRSGKLHGEALLENLNGNPKMEATLSQMLTADEMQRMRRIGGELKAAQAATSKDIGGVINDLPHAMIATPLRIYAARVGAKFGAGTDGASLITANIFSQRVKKYLGKWTNDKAHNMLVAAVQDPQLMKALLTDSTTKPGQKLAARKLEAWLVGPGASLLEEDEEKNNQ